VKKRIGRGWSGAMGGGEVRSVGYVNYGMVCRFRIHSGIGCDFIWCQDGRRPGLYITHVLAKQLMLYWFGYLCRGGRGGLAGIPGL